MILEKKIQINAQNGSGETPMHMLSTYENTKICRMLLNAGADPNSVDNDQQSVLHHMVAQRNIDEVRALIQFGADVMVVDKFMKNPLHNACKSGQLQIVEMLIKAARDQLNPIEKFISLFTGMLGFHVKRMDEFVNLRDNRGKMPVEYARSQGFKDVVLMMRKAGARK